MYLDIQSVNINIWDIQREGQHENLKGGQQKLREMKMFTPRKYTLTHTLTDTHTYKYTHSHTQTKPGTTSNTITTTSITTTMQPGDVEWERLEGEKC